MDRQEEIDVPLKIDNSRQMGIGRQIDIDRQEQINKNSTISSSLAIPLLVLSFRSRSGASCQSSAAKGNVPGDRVDRIDRLEKNKDRLGIDRLGIDRL